MAFLKSISATEVGLFLRGDGITLRPPQSLDYEPWAELRNRSRDFLMPWEPAWSWDELSRSSFRRRIRYYLKDMRDDTGYAFFLFREDDGILLGGLTLSNVRRGVTQSCSLGYWVGAPYACQGYMSKGVRTIIPFVFETLRLHRLEAACLPSNTASKRLLEKAGFKNEGLARRYLRINGVWQDHILYAILEDEAYT
ncbi:MAG: GNAT family N-acetyltransferase [Methyloligellaceae bacterium]